MGAESLKPFAELLRRSRPSPQATPPAMLMVSEEARSSRIRLEQFDGGRDVKYLVAAKTGDAAEPVREWLRPTRELPPTDIVYDCTEQILHGKAKPILCDLESTDVRLFALLPTQFEQMRLTVEESGDGVRRLTIEFCDAGRRRLEGRLPFRLTMQSVDGRELHGDKVRITNVDGRARETLPPGAWKVRVRSLLNRQIDEGGDLATLARPASGRP